LPRGSGTQRRRMVIFVLRMLGDECIENNAINVASITGS
jgi:hypothetical protein